MTVPSNLSSKFKSQFEEVLELRLLIVHSAGQHSWTMEDDLAPRAGGVSQSATRTFYKDKYGNILASREERFFASILEKLSLEYGYEKEEGRPRGIFIVGGRKFIVSNRQQDEVESMRNDVKVVHLPVVDESENKILTISGEQLNFDYAHFIPFSNKCSNLHGHSALVTVQVAGQAVQSGMLIDFGDLKGIAKRVIEQFDHRIIVHKQYVVSAGPDGIQVSYKGQNGIFDLRIPKTSAVIVDFESTVENITASIAEQILKQCPRHVNWVKVTMTEGFGKSGSSAREQSG